jgi:hypothetical protein
MTLLTPVRLHRGFAEVVEREARAARAQGEDASGELDAFIEAEAQQPETIRSLWQSVGDRACSSALEDSTEVESEFRRLFDAALATLGFLRDWAQQFQQGTGRPAKNADLLERIWQAVVELEAKIMSDLAWLNAPAPELSAAQYEEAMADVRRGETVDIEDIIRELQGDLPQGGPGAAG